MILIYCIIHLLGELKFESTIMFYAERERGFVRIGTNVIEIDQAKPYIEHAKSLEMLVSSQPNEVVCRYHCRIRQIGEESG